MKILTDDNYKALKEKADNYDTLVGKLRESTVASDLESFEPQTILEIIETGAQIDSAFAEKTQKELDAANTRISELETKLGTANKRVSELENEIDEIPAEQAATIVAKGETDGKNKDIATFATENRGNTSVIIEKAKEEGLI